MIRICDDEKSLNTYSYHGTDQEARHVDIIILPYVAQCTLLRGERIIMYTSSHYLLYPN